MSIDQTPAASPRKIVRKVHLQGWFEDGEFREPSSRDFLGQVATLVSNHDMRNKEEFTGFDLTFEPRENMSGNIIHDGWLGASYGTSRTALGRWVVKACEPKWADEDGEPLYRVELIEYREKLK